MLSSPTERHALRRARLVRSQSGETYSVLPLTRDLAGHLADEIVQIHNDIPHVNWNAHDVVAETSRDGFTRYTDKFALSIVLLDSHGAVAGVLIAYRRNYSSVHPYEAVYVHRVSVRQDLRGIGLGTLLVRTEIGLVFSSHHDVLTVTVQTNLEHENRHVLRFYEKLGFRVWGPVRYPHKLDVLFEIDRDTFRNGDGSAHLGTGDVTVLAWDEAPVLYLSSGSSAKRTQYAHLARSYGFQLRMPPRKLSMVEPQVDGVQFEAEEELVKFPLRNSARFLDPQHRPLMVDDTMLFVEYFNSDSENWWLPGPDTKRWWAALGDEGVLRIMGSTSKRGARYVAQIGIATAKEYHAFRADVVGRISHEVSRPSSLLSGHPYTDSLYFHSIFTPDGSSCTLAEMEADEFIRFDYRRKCFERALPTLRAEARRVQERLF